MQIQWNKKIYHNIVICFKREMYLFLMLPMSLKTAGLSSNCICIAFSLPTAYHMWNDRTDYQSFHDQIAQNMAVGRDTFDLSCSIDVGKVNIKLHCSYLIVSTKGVTTERY